jgi:hypothetical protein
MNLTDRPSGKETMNLEDEDTFWKQQRVDTVNWLNTRKNYITASTVHNLLKASRTKINVEGIDLTPAQFEVLSNRLTTYTEEDSYAPSKAAARGHEIEATLAKDYLEPKGYHHWDNMLVVSPDKRFGCSPDYLDIPQDMSIYLGSNTTRKISHELVPATKAVEVKAFGASKHLQIALTKEIPIEIQMQLTWYKICIPTLEQIQLLLVNEKVDQRYQFVCIELDDRNQVWSDEHLKNNVNEKLVSIDKVYNMLKGK